MIKHWRKVLVISYPLAVLCWTLPAGYFPFKATLDQFIAKPFLMLNLWQAWDMFAPTPRSDDIWVQATITDRQGQKQDIPLTDMRTMPYAERWQKERWRKYFNDHLRTDARTDLWEPYTRYLSNDLAKRAVTVDSIQLTRWWRPAINPVSPELRANRRIGGWNHFTFYTWTQRDGAH